MTSDDGLRFVATVRTTDGAVCHHETEDRVAFLAWLSAHARAEDAVTITMEASGPAVPGMMAALRFGAHVLKRVGGER